MMLDVWFDGLVALNVWGLEGGCNGCDGLVELNVWGEDGGCYGCSGLLELIMRFIGYIQQLRYFRNWSISGDYLHLLLYIVIRTYIYIYNTQLHTYIYIHNTK